MGVVYRARQQIAGADLDDAVQEVFLACFRDGGVLGRADPERPGGFRAFLYGVARNVARQAEARRGRRPGQPPDGRDLADLAADDESLSAAFDRAWAKALMREAARRQGRRPPACTTNTPGRATSSAPPCARSWPFTTPALPTKSITSAASWLPCWAEKERAGARKRRPV
jgi:hypothetical protein